MEIYTRWVALPALGLCLLNLSPKRRERERRKYKKEKKRKWKSKMNLKRRVEGEEQCLG